MQLAHETVAQCTKREAPCFNARGAKATDRIPQINIIVPLTTAPRLHGSSTQQRSETGRQSFATAIFPKALPLAGNAFFAYHQRTIAPYPNRGAPIQAIRIHQLRN